MVKLPEEKQKELLAKAWEAMDIFVSDILEKLKSEGLTVEGCICGSLARLEAECPRNYGKFLREVEMSIEYEIPDRETRERLRNIKSELERKCNDADCFIAECGKLLEAGADEDVEWLCEEAARQRCSDVDGKVVLGGKSTDEIWRIIRRLHWYVAEKNEEIRKLVEPLEPEYGFMPKEIAELIRYKETCLCKEY